MAEQNEIFHLQHNSSSASEIRLVDADDLLHGDVALLVPQSQSLSRHIDFRAFTIGVSSQCISITTDCEMRYDTQYPYHTLFNCSENFWGVLGKSPNISEVDGTFYPTPYVPPLGYKPAPNLQSVASLYTMSFLLTILPGTHSSRIKTYKPSTTRSATMLRRISRIHLTRHLFRTLICLTRSIWLLQGESLLRSSPLEAH